MIYGITSEGQRIEASPGLEAICPCCDAPLLAKCGTINVWHWAHKVGMDCDPWSEGETKWHLQWKKEVDAAYRECLLGNHRADICMPNKLVIELQASHISAEDICEREEFYGNMIWLVKADDIMPKRFKIRRYRDYLSFRWMHPKKSYWACKKPIFLDFCDGRIFEIKKLYPNMPCGGWGLLWNSYAFSSTFLNPTFQTSKTHASHTVQSIAHDL